MKIALILITLIILLIISFLILDGFIRELEKIDIEDRLFDDDLDYYDT